jgi:hypothetical protein
MDTLSLLCWLLTPVSSWVVWLVPLLICAFLVYGIEKATPQRIPCQQRTRQSGRSSMRFVNTIATTASVATIVVVDETDDRFQ